MRRFGYLQASCAFLAAGLVVLVAASARADEDLAPTIQARVEADWVQQDKQFVPAGQRQAVQAAPAASPAAAGGLPGKATTTAQDAAGGCDGVKTGYWGFHTASGEQDPWWQVDLGRDVELARVVIYNRMDSPARTTRLMVQVATSDGDEACKEFKTVYRHDGKPFGGAADNKPLVVDLADKKVTARVVRLAIAGKVSFALDEVEVYGAGEASKNLALSRPAEMKSIGPYSYPGSLSVDQCASISGRKVAKPTAKSIAKSTAKTTPPNGKPSDSAKTTAEVGAFALEHTREVIARGRKLALRVRTSFRTPSEKPVPEGWASELDKLEERLDAMAKMSTPPGADERRSIYLDARRTLRSIAFANPQLASIDKLLFITRHDAGGPYHMCDQYYGCNAKPGGGLYVLENPFGEKPVVRDLLKDAVVANGRLKGQKLEGGSFLSPELSFDGRTILFAWTQAKATKTYQWAPEYSYHIFKVNADGSDLIQLTDGPENDFDPCFLPNGRIVFVSERRGGYLRCGRHCPVYTMFSMAADGSDIAHLSFHETHEWHPSVTNDGMLVYTRWDYVDRDTNVAHHIWTCYPDGRDPRSFHGNYPQKRENRPWMEMQIRSVPGSPLFVASTGAHHGHEFGSLVLIDPRLRDDGAMSQLVRLTPDTPFPEATRGVSIASLMRYGTPWPLSEQDFLCVYDQAAKHHAIYWIDRHGNRELIYRDDKVPCYAPIPLRPRPTPPILSEQSGRIAQGGNLADTPMANVSVVNVYDSDFDWPAGTKVHSLRIVQVLPKLTAPPNQPRVGVAQQTNARQVLGTVPVEADGSAHFQIPSGKAVYFQALDEHGLAVMSMRSAAYFQPGEKLTCQGCHERKLDTPPPAAKVPLALRRAPSTIQPEVEGSNPFSFTRLVQPALDRNCVACHKEKKAVDLSGQVGGPNGWTRSYAALAGKYGFYFDVTNGSFNGARGGSRTTAGKFGAMASPLMKYLDAKHHGVKLSAEDYRRFTLWLDLNSEFLGAYEKVAEQARGEVVQPSLQ